MFKPRRWSTPIGGYRAFGTRRIGAIGTGRWWPDNDENDFDYLEFFVDDITYDESAPPPFSAAALSTPASMSEA